MPTPVTVVFLVVKIYAVASHCTHRSTIVPYLAIFVERAGVIQTIFMLCRATYCRTLVKRAQNEAQPPIVDGKFIYSPRFELNEGLLNAFIETAATNRAVFWYEYHLRWIFDSLGEPSIIRFLQETAS